MALGTWVIIAVVDGKGCAIKPIPLTESEKMLPNNLTTEQSCRILPSNSALDGPKARSCSSDSWRSAVGRWVSGCESL